MTEPVRKKTGQVGKPCLNIEGLRAQKICKTYGTQENPVYALKETSFQIPKGQFAAILGPSGCGKSTLLHVLGGIEEPDGGSVWIKGKDLYQMERSKRAVFRRRSIGMVYQSIFLLPALNIEENIILPLLLDGRRAREKQLLGLLRETGLEAKREALPSQLSGGQQQRAAIARALVMSPSVLLADEPTGNLDKANRNGVMELFRRLNDIYQVTILMVTHDEELASQCDRILYMEDGQIIRDREL